MKNYALVGRGGSNKRVIAASLNDLPEDSHIHLMWTGEPTPAEEVVYDWLIDNEKTFTVYGTKVPKGIARYAEEVSEEPMYKTVENLGGNTALVLWEEGMDDIVIGASAFFPKMLELTNGLTPIEIDDDEAAASTPIEEEVVIVEQKEFFTREELENMPAAAVKRQAKEKGLDISGKVKSQIIDMLLNGEASDPVIIDTAPKDEVRAIVDSIKSIDEKMTTLYEEIELLNDKRRNMTKALSQMLGYDGLIS